MEQRKQRNYIVSSFVAIFIVWTTSACWPEVFGPLKVFGAPFWQTHGNIGDWLIPVWWLFAWGIGLNIIKGLLNPFMLHETSAKRILSVGALISLFAGVTEELAFRWLIYLSAIAMVVFANWLWSTVFIFFLMITISLGIISLFVKNHAPPWLTGLVASLCLTGFLLLILNGKLVDPVKWFYETLLLPLADWTSFGYLHPYLVTSNQDPDAWALGAGVVSANVFFRDGHKYQGFLGTINAWFGGMVFFWVMFTFGLLPAMLIHFLYNFSIFATAACMRFFRSSPSF